MWGNIKAWERSARAFTWDQLLPQFSAYWAEENLKRQQQALREQRFSFEGFDLDEERQDNLLEQLERSYEAEGDRKNRIVEKGRSALFIIGVAVPVMTTSLVFVNMVGITLLELLLLLFGVVSLVLSAISVVHAVGVRPHHGRYIDQMFHIDGTRLTVSATSTRELIEQFYHFNKLNQKPISAIANYVDAAYIGIRNGIILLGLFFGIALFRLYLAPNTPEKNATAMAPMFESEEHIVQFIERRGEEINKILIPQHRFMLICDPQKPDETSLIEAGCIITLEGGDVRLVRPEHAGLILNSDVLARKRIRIELER